MILCQVNNWFKANKNTLNVNKIIFLKFVTNMYYVSRGYGNKTIKKVLTLNILACKLRTLTGKNILYILIHFYQVS